MQKINVNPKGLRTGDCVVRAIAYALDKPWDEVYRDLCDLGFKLKRMPNDKQTYEKYLQQQGWLKQPQPRKQSGTKYSIKELLKEYYLYYRGKPKKIVISCANHLTCAKVEEGFNELVDTWDCGYKTVGNYWIKGENYETKNK